MKYGDAVDVHGSRDAQVAVFADSRAATHRWETRGAPIRSFECGLARSKSVALCSWPPRVAHKVVTASAWHVVMWPPLGFPAPIYRGFLFLVGPQHVCGMGCGVLAPQLAVLRAPANHACIAFVSERTCHAFLEMSPPHAKRNCTRQNTVLRRRVLPRIGAACAWRTGARARANEAVPHITVPDVAGAHSPRPLPVVVLVQNPAPPKLQPYRRRRRACGVCHSSSG